MKVLHADVPKFTCTFVSLFSVKLNNKSATQEETIAVLRSTINVLDKEKDTLQESIDEKTERIACLDDNLANKVGTHNMKLFK